MLGGKMKIRDGILRLCLVVAVVGLTSTEALGGSLAREGDAVTGELVAPNLQDHADYYSKDRSDVTKADLRKADKLRKKTIRSIRSLLNSNKKKVRRFELLLRLGELHAERHDFIRDLEMRRYDEAYKKWQETSKDKRGQEPQLDTSRSRAQLTRAANSFRRLVRKFPKHPRTDAALYSLAKTLARLGKSTSVNYYKQLLRTHPKSPLVPDTQLALGEYYFQNHKVDQAIHYYRKAMQHKKHKAYPYAVYKLGWAFYNADAKNEKEADKNYNKAVAAFKLVVKLAERNQRTQSRNLDLKGEAIRDLIMVWAEAEDVKSAWNYFQTIGDKDSFYKMLERLGNIYFEQGQNEKAIAVFRRLLRDAPLRENNPKVHAKLVRLYDMTGQPSSVVAQLKRLPKLYMNDAEWVAANKKEDAVKDAQELVEHNIHRYGALFHKRGQDMDSKSYMKHAASVYSLYLSHFPKNKNAYDIRYYLAEILFDFKRYEDASRHYMKVAKAKKDGQYRKSAAVNAVGAMNQLVSSKDYKKLPPAGQVSKPLPIPASKTKLVAAIDQFVKLLPKKKEGYPMRYTAAQTYFDYGHYDKAIKRYHKITKEIPGTKQSTAAVKTILSYYSEREDWGELVAWSNRFTGQEKLLDEKLQTYVVDLLRSAMFKQALAQEKSEEYQKAAKSFMEYQKKFPGDKNADRALYNASLNFHRVGKIQSGLHAGNMLLEQYKDSDLKPDVMARMATTYESLARFDEGASMYRRLAVEFPKDDRSASAMFNAAVLYKGKKNRDAAIQLFESFIKKHSSHKLAPQATMDLAELLEKEKRYKDAVDVYNIYAGKHAESRSKQLYAKAKAAALTTFHLGRTGGERKIDSVAKKLEKKGSPNAYDARRVVAEAMFKLSEPKFGAFQAMALDDGSSIEKDVQAKQKELVKLADVYNRIIRVGSPEYSVASLYRLGVAHENFSEALFNAPAPRGASESAVDAFRTELEKVAFPLREEAYSFFDTAYKRSQEVQTFTDWTRRTYEKMVELAPEKHPEVNEMSADPGYLAHDIPISPAVAAFVED